MKFAEIMAKSTLVPKDYIDKPGNILVAIQKGFEIGLTPMNALESIAVINGRCTLWGDGMLALVQASPAYEWHDENETSDSVGVHVIKRKGHEAHRSVFSLEDAKRAGLLGKAGPWQQYTKRMLMLRARGFALRDKFADALKGMISAEEAMDIPPPTPEYLTPTSLKEKLKAQVERAAVPEPVPPVSDATPGSDGPHGGPADFTKDLDSIHHSQLAKDLMIPKLQDGPPMADLTAKMRLCESIKEWSDVENVFRAIEEQGACTGAERAVYISASQQKKKSLTGKR